MLKYKVIYSRKCTKCSFHDSKKAIMCSFKPLLIDEYLSKLIRNECGVACPRCNSNIVMTPLTSDEIKITLWDHVIEHFRNKDTVDKEKFFNHLIKQNIDVKKKYYTIYGYIAMLQKSGYVVRKNFNTFEVVHTIPFGLKESECMRLGYVDREPLKSNKQESEFKLPRESDGVSELSFR